MDVLRLSLLFIGLLLVVGVYLTGRYRFRKQQHNLKEKNFSFGTFLSRVISKRQSDEQERVYEDPDLIEASLAELDLKTDDRYEDYIADDVKVEVLESHEEAVSQGEFLLIFRIMAPVHQPFEGSDIQSAALAAGMEFGDMEIFHLYPAKQSDSAQKPLPICSLANAVEPGSFKLQTITDVKTPGLSLFMQLPGPLDGREAFELTLEAGRKIAEHLGGELCDESRSVVTAQTIGHLKEKLESYRFKSRMAQIKNRHS